MASSRRRSSSNDNENGTMTDIFQDGLRRQRNDGKLFGQHKVQSQRIQQILEQTTKVKSPHGILVHGYSGSGKTRLVEHAISKFINSSTSTSNNSPAAAAAAAAASPKDSSPPPSPSPSTRSSIVSNYTKLSTRPSSTNLQHLQNLRRRPRGIWITGNFEESSSSSSSHPHHHSHHHGGSNGHDIGRPYSALIDACRELFFYLAESQQHDKEYDDDEETNAVDETNNQLFLKQRKLIFDFLETSLQKDESLLTSLLPELIVDNNTTTTTGATTTNSSNNRNNNNNNNFDMSQNSLDYAEVIMGGDEGEGGGKGGGGGGGTVGNNKSLVFDRFQQQQQQQQQASSANSLDLYSAIGTYQSDTKIEQAIITLLTGVSQYFPLILFLDDLQWADQESLKLITNLLSSSSSTTSSTFHNATTNIQKTTRFTTTYLQQLIIIGAYRDNEMNQSHILYDAIQTLDTLSSVTNINVIDLSLTDLNIFISDLLKYEDTPHVTQSLSTNVHRRTHGNIFFVLQFLEMLVSCHILSYSWNTLQWEWDKQQLENKTNSTDNVVDLVLEKMRRLPTKSALAMLIASQLGSRFDITIACSIVEQWTDQQQQEEEDLQKSFSASTVIVDDPLFFIEGGGGGRDDGEEDNNNKEENDLPGSTRRTATGCCNGGDGRGGRHRRISASMQQLFAIPITEGFVAPVASKNGNRSGGGGGNGSGRWYRFTHDRIQQGAARLCDKDRELELLRLRMGRLLYSISKEETIQTQWAILRSADLQNMARQLLLQDERKEGQGGGGGGKRPLTMTSSTPTATTITTSRLKLLDLIRVNLEAAKITRSQSAFVAASKYLTVCREVLQQVPSMKWTESFYDLTLDVYTFSAEMAFCSGNAEDVCRQVIREVLQHGMKVQERLYVTYIWIKILGCQACYDECITFAYKALNQANFSMATTTTKSTTSSDGSSTMMTTTTTATTKSIEGELSRAFQQLSELTDKEIVNLRPDPMVGYTELSLKILSSLLLFTWYSNRMLDFTMLACRWLIYTLEHGLSEYSGLCFALFGQCSGVHMEITVAKRMFELSVHPKIQTLYEGKELEGATVTAGYAATGHLSVPLTTVLSELMSGYRTAMRAGSVEWGVAGSAAYLLSYYISGLPLSIFETDSIVFIDQMVRHNNRIHRPICQLYLQCALNLMGKGNNPMKPYLLEGKMLQDYDVSKIIDGTLTNFPIQVGWFVQLMLAYYFQEYDLAVKMANSQEENASLQWPLVWAVPHPYFRGLAYLAKARELKAKKNKGTVLVRFGKRLNMKLLVRQAKKQLDQIRVYAGNRMLNSLHMLKILEAELVAFEASGKSKRVYVKRAYDQAIAMAMRSGFRQDAALASERYGMYVAEIDREEAGHYFVKAMKLYKEWGAEAKVTQIRKDHHVCLEGQRMEKQESIRSSFQYAKVQSNSTRGGIYRKSSPDFDELELD